MRKKKSVSRNCDNCYRDSSLWKAMVCDLQSYGFSLSKL